MCFCARRALAGAGVADFVLVHCFEGFADAEHEDHETAFREACVVYEIGVYGVLEVAATVVGENDVDCFAAGGVAVCDADAGDF